MSSLPMFEASMTIKTKHNLALQHLMAAIRFAKKVGELEEENAGKEFSGFFEEIISYVSAAIQSSVSALEANINEIFLDEKSILLHSTISGKQHLWTVIEEKPILEKYKIAISIKAAEPYDTGKNPYQDAANLISLRNELVHFKPQWTGDLGPHQKLEKRLHNKFSLSPFLPSNAVFFPQKCMSYGCAKWAVNSSIKFMEDLCIRTGIEDRFAKHLHKILLK